MNTTYTPLPLSKIISERLTELETDMWWASLDNGDGDIYEWRVGKNYIEEPLEKYPAPTFTDLLRAIEMLGEKEGWDDIATKEDKQNRKTFANGVQHCLLDAFIADNHTIGEHTIAYLTELFTKEK